MAEEPTKTTPIGKKDQSKPLPPSEPPEEKKSLAEIVRGLKEQKKHKGKPFRRIPLEDPGSEYDGPKSQR